VLHQVPQDHKEPKVLEDQVEVQDHKVLKVTLDPRVFHVITIQDVRVVVISKLVIVLIPHIIINKHLLTTFKE